MKFLPRLLFLLIFAGAVRAQTGPDTLWTHTFDWIAGEQEDVQAPDRIEPTPSGYLISGALTSEENSRVGARYYIRIKLNGDTLWTQKCSGLDPTAIPRCIQCGFRQYRWELAVLNRWNEWTETVGEDTLLYNAQAITASADQSGWFVAGSILDPNGNSSTPQYLMKTDSVGNRQWMRRLDDVWPDDHVRLEKLLPTHAGGVIAVGNAWSVTERKNRMAFVSRWTADGDPVWPCRTDLASMGSDLDAALLGDESILLLGKSAVQKISATGQSIWSAALTGYRYEDGAVLQVVPSGFLILGLRPVMEDPQTRNMAIVKMDTSGTLEWNRSYGGASKYLSRAQVALQTAGGGYLIGGYWDGQPGIVRLGPDPLK